MKPALRRILAQFRVSALLGGCSIATPFRTVSPASGGEARVLVVTHATVRPEQRSRFDEQTRRVIATLAARPGLIGYSLRFEALGDELWTLTIWADEAAREAFFRSPAHQEAVASAAQTLRAARFLHFSLPADAERPTWPELLERLEREGRSYAFAACPAEGSERSACGRP